MELFSVPCVSLELNKNHLLLFLSLKKNLTRIPDQRISSNLNIWKHCIQICCMRHAAFLFSICINKIFFSFFYFFPRVRISCNTSHTIIQRRVETSWSMSVSSRSSVTSHDQDWDLFFCNLDAHSIFDD